MQAARNEDQYHHLILTLGMRHVLRHNWGFQAQLIEESTFSTPDLMVYNGGKAIAAMEIKTKAALVDPLDDGVLSLDNAKNIVEKAVRSTGNSDCGQLRKELPGLLVIAGFFIRPGQMRILRRAATEWFKKRERTSFPMILFASAFVYVRDSDPDPKAAMEVEAAINPHYSLGHKTAFYALHSGTEIVWDSETRRWDADEQTYMRCIRGRIAKPKGKRKKQKLR